MTQNPVTQDHWTDRVKDNRSFRRELRAEYPRSFTNADAYQIYYDAHKTTRPCLIELTEYQQITQEIREVRDQWYQMNVRNLLCMWEHRGVLIRVAPGHYAWRVQKH